MNSWKISINYHLLLSIYMGNKLYFNKKMFIKKSAASFQSAPFKSTI